ncbi:MAG: MXAN_5187 C-terminal domain-containing protein [Acidobacteriota bacterium]
MRTNQELDRLDQQLKELRIEFEKYFNGANDLPPGELQSHISQALRRLRTAVKGSVDNFRLNSLEARFNSYNEMFNRRVRDVEEGRAHIRRAAPIRTGPDAYAGVLVESSIGEIAAAALYKGLYEGSSKVDLGSFQGYLNKQAAAIRSKTGCTQVQFRLAEEGGKTKLKAKAVK